MSAPVIRPPSWFRLSLRTASSLILLGTLAVAGAVAAIAAFVLAKSVTGTLSLVSRDAPRGRRLGPP